MRFSLALTEPWERCVTSPGSAGLKQKEYSQIYGPKFIYPQITQITQISFRDSGYTSELKNIVYLGLADSVLP
jgi:hypothetical protein